MMTGMFRFTQFSTAALIAVALLSNYAWAQLSATGEGPMRPIDRLALLESDYSVTKTPTAAKANEPVPFSISKMASDSVPPFACSPKLAPVSPAANPVEISFKENMPVEESQPNGGESIDDCCRELTAMIAGNLESEISLDAKKQMIETALKMVARNVALKAEAKIIKLKADHALDMARMQSQIGRMRSTNSAADQINRVAGPLSQLLHRNYQQAVAMNIGNQKLSQALAQLGYQQLEEEARIARANRQRIQLKTPANQTRQETENQWRAAELSQQLARLQQQLESQNHQSDSEHANESVRQATFNQPLLPRRQPLEPLPRRQTNEYFDANPYQQLPEWQR